MVKYETLRENLYLYLYYVIRKVKLIGNQIPLTIEIIT